MLTRSTHVLFALALVGLTVSCRGGATAPTPTVATDTFTGTINVLGSQSKTFTVTYSAAYSDASITVTSLTNVSNNAAISPTIGIGFGSINTFDGSCVRSSYSSNAASLNQELTATGVFQNGQYCVQIFDVGTLTEPANYTFIVKHF